MDINIKRSLIIDDDEDYRNLIVRKLSRCFPDIIINEIDPLSDEMPDEFFCWDNIDFIILDYNFGLEYTGLDWFKKFKVKALPATILLTAKGSEELAVKAMKLGIDDYIVKEHFDNEKLTESIKECVLSKNLERSKLIDLQKQGNAFNKSNFIQRLKLITEEQDTNNHLFLINPIAFQQIGEQQGINHQDGYIKYISDLVHDYLNTNNISHNVFIYREEYIAVIVEVSCCKKYLDELFKLLQDETYNIGQIKYKCSINIGVISPQVLDTKELDKSDFELLSIALVLCNSVKSDEKRYVCSYGDIDIKETSLTGDSQSFSQLLEAFNIENAIKDGRVLINYQPWVYILPDDETGVKDFYDVRIEFIDIKGNKISQNVLINLLDEAYAKRIVDKWILKNTVSSLKEIFKTNSKNNIKLAVKITLSSFTDPLFMPWLKELLIEAKLPSDCLLIEVDATQFIRAPDDYKLLFDTIGIKFNIRFILSGIFDINKYYQAREFHIFEYIKLNINHLTSGRPRGPLNKLVQDIKNDDAKIVAVNVSDAQKLNMATEFGVDYMHGYLIGKPTIDVISDSDGDFYCVM
jgi:EAL domain-containing protein (putative c-di-GMP-specific phosphodiesterase class I)/DNA-binding NarL/FixJ family response regulator